MFARFRTTNWKTVSSVLNGTAVLNVALAISLADGVQLSGITPEVGLGCLYDMARFLRSEQ